MFELEVKPEGLLLPIKAVPGSSKSRFAGIWDHKLKIAIAAAPEKGKANKELIGFLAKSLKLSKSAISIVAGEHDSHKKLLLTGCDRASIVRTIEALLPEAACDRP